jgi:hypothetical protein
MLSRLWLEFPVAEIGLAGPLDNPSIFSKVTAAVGVQ